MIAIMGGLISSVFAQTYGQWPMGGLDTHRSGHKTIDGKDVRPPYTAGAAKWSYTPGGGDGTPINGVALGEPSDPNAFEYKVYYFGNDKKLYRLQVSYNSGTYAFSVSKDYQGSYTLAGTPIGSPVLGYSNGTKAVFIIDTDRRLYCLDASDGSKVWRSAQLGSSGDTLSAPLYLPFWYPDTQPNHDGNRVYVPSSNGRVYAFNPSGYSSGSDASEEWSYSTGFPIVRPMSTIFRIPSVGSPPEELLSPFWNIVLANSDGHAQCIFDYGDHAVLQWTFAPDSNSETCNTWPIVGNDNAPNIRVYIATFDSSNQGYVYSIRGDDDIGGDKGTAAWSSPMTTASDNGTQRTVGRIDANPCIEVPSGDTNAFFLAQTAGTGTGKPTPVKADDQGSSGSGAFGKKMNTTSDNLSSTAMFTNADSNNCLYWATDTGYIYCQNPSVFGGSAQSAMRYPFPIHPASSIPTQDLAIDLEGAVVLTLGNGKVAAYWGPNFIQP